MAMSKTPEMTHRVFTVIKREGQDDYWLSIGAAFEHADGKGYNVILQALPIDGKLVLRVPKDDEEDDRTPPRRDDQRNNKSGQRRR
jgi:hypothetical protein